MLYGYLTSLSFELRLCFVYCSIRKNRYVNIYWQLSLVRRWQNCLHVICCFPQLMNKMFYNIILVWLVNLYRGYLSICAGGEHQLSSVDRHAEAAAAHCLREWRRLPSLVSHGHLPLLRAAQQLMELTEAAQIHTVRIRLSFFTFNSLVRVHRGTDESKVS